MVVVLPRFASGSSRTMQRWEARRQSTSPKSILEPQYGFERGCLQAYIVMLFYLFFLEIAEAPGCLLGGPAWGWEYPGGLTTVRQRRVKLADQKGPEGLSGEVDGRRCA